MGKILRFIGLLSIFACIVGCCAKKIPNIDVARDIPIDPGSVLFVVGANLATQENISGTALVIESNKHESWAVSAGHVCYPEPYDPLVMWNELWATMGFDHQGNYEPMFMIALDQTKDICVFRIPMGNLPAVPLAKDPPVIGEKVYVGAYPLGVYNPNHVPFFEGYYAGILDGRASFTIPVTGGSSGGGIVNKEGELVGIVSMALEGFEHITIGPELKNVQTVLDVAKKHPERLTIIR